MADELVESSTHLPGERSQGALEPVPERVAVDSLAGKLTVEWAPRRPSRRWGNCRSSSIS